jgi:hypothetical protein
MSALDQYQSVFTEPMNLTAKAGNFLGLCAYRLSHVASHASQRLRILRKLLTASS